jgi:capsular exopolysaccharide synthesis family protein
MNEQTMAARSFQGARKGPRPAEGGVLLTPPSAKTAESIRALRTIVLAQHIQGGKRGLAICAPAVGVGATFLAVNLAVALAQSGLRTLLIDADLRSPSVQKHLRPSRESGGLRACLSEGRADVADEVDAEIAPNLSVLYAGARGADAHELLSRESFEAVINACLREYDITIVDTSPANISADARRVSNVVGHSLVVARRNETMLSDIQTLVQQLQRDHANVVGTVLNDG